MRLLVCTAALVCAAVSVSADPLPQNPWQQVPSQQMAPQNAAPLWTPDQLRNLVAPVALYPDPLLGQILAASTYPLEIVEAQQWLRQNSGLQGQPLVDAMKQQGWDPSVGMLAEFPEAMTLLNRDIRWTTDLGNAFLSQQADVMNAIQYLRMEARDSGRLQSSPQQVVSEETQNGESAVSIEPTNPQVIYPPVYNPVSVWGQPALGSYPAFSYAPTPYYGNGYGFGSGINIAGLFSGVLSWNGWGWALGWFTHTLSLASLFFNILGFHGLGGIGGGVGFHTAGGVGTMALWSHDPSHRLGVPYPRGFSASQTARSLAPTRENSPRTADALRNSQALRSTEPERYNQPLRLSENQRYSSSNYSPAQRYGAQSFTSPQRYSTPQSFAPSRQPAQNFSEQRFSEPKYSAQKYSEPKYSAQKFSSSKFSEPKFSAPKFSAPKASKAPKSSGGHSSGKSHKH